jgi:hypothetical protein
MARFGFADSFVSQRSLDECRTAARAAIVESGAKLKGASHDTEIVGTSGSGIVIRLIGGLIAPARWFPTRLSVTLQDDGGERRVEVSVVENFGLGTLAGIEEKVGAHCKQVCADLAASLKRALL